MNILHAFLLLPLAQEMSGALALQIIDATTSCMLPEAHPCVTINVHRSILLYCCAASETSPEGKWCLMMMLPDWLKVARHPRS